MDLDVIPSFSEVIYTDAEIDALMRAHEFDPSVSEDNVRQFRPRSGAAVDRDAQGDQLKATRRFPCVWFKEVNTKLAGRYLIKGLLDEAAIAEIYGPAGCGKTFLAIDLACHIAAGMPWRGKRVHGGPVIYIAAEAGESILRRFAAWKQYRLADSRKELMPLIILTRGANLLDEAEVAELMAQLHQIKEEAGEPIRLVVFDTLSRSIPGGDDSTSRDMGCVVAVCERIRDELKATTLLIHHAGKDPKKGSRGSNTIPAAADTVLAVNGQVMVVEKVRDGVAGEHHGFELEQVEMGVDQDGDPITTCVVRHLHDTPKVQKASPMSTNETLALAALKEISVTPLPAAGGMPPGKLGATIEEWRKQFYARLGESKEIEKDSRRRAFTRAKVGLLEKQQVGAREGYAWVL